MVKEETLDDVLNSANVSERTEMGEVFDNLDNDTPNPDTKLNKIDFNTRLTNTEINNIMIFEELRNMGIMPDEATLTQQKKRLNISLNGAGRQEKVSIATASVDAKRGGASGGFLARMFSPRV